MERAAKLLILPGVLGFLVAAALGLLLATLWQAAAVGVDTLNGQVYDRAMQDRVYHDRIMEAVSGATDTILLVGATVAWVSALGWFFSCWRTPIAQVGAVRRLRPRWGWICLSGLLPGLAAAGYVAFMTSQLSVLISIRSLLYTFLFLAPFFAVIYYATAVLCTHRVYLAAIPWSRWRPW